MKQSGFKFLLAAVLAAALVGSPFFLEQADTRGFGGGGYRGSGFGGGSFREGHEGDYVGGRGGTYQGYHDRNYSGGNVNVNENINVNRGWGSYYGPGWGGVAAGAAAGVAAGLAIGATVASLPPAATQIAVYGQTYYVVGNTYYQPCFTGAETSYCVVASPY
jgi:hypothetical protein